VTVSEISTRDRIVAGRKRGLRRPGQRVPWLVLSVIACGGALGALARYALAAALPHPPDAFPWATFVTNVSGCFLIGVLMALWPKHRVLRPFLGIGVLGGFTTFSTYVLETQQALAVGAPGVALLYFGGTALTALLAVFAGVALVRVIR
jgi:fluoride exporter